VKAALWLVAATLAATVAPDRPSDVRRHVAVLADDAMAGREAGTAAYGRAADYVTGQFRAAGLKPYPGIGWRQRVPLIAISPSGPGRAVMTRDGGSNLLSPDQIALSLPVRPADERVFGEVMAAGHCVSDRAAGIDDFAEIDLRGKIAACKMGAPAHLPAAARTVHGDPREQARAARQRGAIGIVIVQSRGQADSTSFARIARAWRAPRLVLDDPDGEGRVLGLLSAASGERMLTGPGRVFLAIEASSRREARASDNVVGWLPGSDPRLQSEVVVISAHLDHLGDNVAPSVGSTDRIANGALDNAIGVATIIEAARRLARAPRKPARGIVFVAFTAEEDGLLGSRWFVRNLPAMRRRPIANVNIDMPILTYSLADYLVQGSGWVVLPGVSRLERRAGLPVTQEPGTAPPSDNLSFARIGVPTYVPLPGEGGEGLAASRLFTREHYHRASDDLALAIDWASAERYATFVRLLTECLADGWGEAGTRR
jgi:hypothetical protein